MKIKLALFAQLWQAVSIVFNRDVIGGDWLDADTFVIRFAPDEVQRRLPEPIINERMRK